jgi:hypothetical protein
LAIVGPNPHRESVGAEEPLEGLLGRRQQRSREPVTGQEIAGVSVLDGERVAVAAIAQAELAFEVDRPDDVGSRDGSVRAAGMGANSGPPAVADATVPDRIRWMVAVAGTSAAG